ncbi:MAG: hypothetical protein AB7G54_11865 [Methyloceanibacter sp.]
MSPSVSSLSLSLFAAFIIATQGGVNAAPTLAEAVNAADARYRTVRDIVGDDSAPKLEAGSGEEAAAPGTQEVAQGTIKAVLSYTEDASDDEEIMRTPVVTVFAGDRQVAKLEAESSGFADPPVSVQIAELDPGNPYPEIVVSFYTGGAHCCSDTRVVTSSPDGSIWTTVELGQFDGGPLLATDVDGDGRYEFMIRDNAFLYAFACYACSEAPLNLLAIDNGAIKDVTREARFRPAHAATLKSMIENVPEEGNDVNGFLAGYVGEKILLGEGKQAFELMLAHYDRESDWGLETCDKPLNDDGECPGKVLRLTFPQALERMLNENGYKIEE